MMRTHRAACMGRLVNKEAGKYNMIYIRKSRNHGDNLAKTLQSVSLASNLKGQVALAVSL